MKRSNDSLSNKVSEELSERFDKSLTTWESVYPFDGKFRAVFGIGVFSFPGGISTIHKMYDFKLNELPRVLDEFVDSVNKTVSRNNPTTQREGN